MYITRTSKISNHGIEFNGLKVLGNDDNLPFAEFIKIAFKSLNKSYPQFYKMDSLSKLAMATTEFLWQDYIPSAHYAGDEIAIVILNSASTLNTDVEHQNSIQSRDNYFPSPAIFVYTLPNIMMGEICIRQKLFGENLLLVTESFDADMLHRQVKILMDNGKATAVLAGWVDINEDRFESFLMWIEPENFTDSSEEIVTFAPPIIEKIFNNK